jgi:hypothetical protein
VVRSWRGSLERRESYLKVYDANFDHDYDQEAVEARILHELRGVIVGQVAEIENLLLVIVDDIDKHISAYEPRRRSRTGAGAALAEVRKRLKELGLEGQFADQLDTIQIVIRRRNSLVHGTIHIGFSRVHPDAPLESVIYLLFENGEPDTRPLSLRLEDGDPECDERQLLGYLEDAYIALESGIDIWEGVEGHFGDYG